MVFRKDKHLIEKWAKKLKMHFINLKKCKWTISIIMYKFTGKHRNVT